MRGAARVALAALLAGSAFGSEVQVRPRGELVDVVASAAPLQDVLARLSQQTGMKVVYDGTPPRAIVTATLPQRTPVEAVLALFEGLGINYALKTDAGGTKVDTLIVMGAAAAPASRGGAAQPPPSQPAPESRRPPFQPPVRPQPGAEPDEQEEREEQPEPDENARPQPERPVLPPPATFNGVIPGPGRPGSPFGSGQVGPLTLPTPATAPVAPQQPGAIPAPMPSPTPGANR
jgi:hypothetical protein